MPRKSFLRRIDGDSSSVNGSHRSRKGSGPSGMQVYKDLNSVLGTIFRMIGGFFGIDVDKYARKAVRKSVRLSGRKVRKGKPKSFMQRWGLK